MNGANENGAPGSAGSSLEARPLNVSDALGYLDAVKLQFQDKPDVYNHFLDIMKDFKSQVIDTPGVIERVSMLFHGNPLLIQGFNTFLPPGYRIELNNEYSDTITVTTPMGRVTQRTTMYGIPQGLPRESMLAPGMVPQYTQPPFGLPPPPVLPVGIGNGSRPVTPIPIHAPPPPHIVHEMQSMRQTHQGPQSPALGGRDDAALLGSLNTRQTEKAQNGEFHHAINYLSKIKNRFSDDPETYKQFLEILQTYQKEQRHIQDQSQVYAQVQMLFKDAPDLMDEFKDFLPEAVPPMHQLGLVGILPQPATGPGVPGSFAPPEPPAAEKSTKPQNKRRKRPEKEPAAPPKAAGGRAAKRAKTTNNQRTEPASPKFSPYQVPHSPQPVNMHVHPIPPPMHQQAGMQPVPIRPASVGPMGPAQSSGQDELLFFDRAKKALEGGGTYDEFLKLLNMFSRDIIDTKTLIDRAEVFLGDGELLTQFKDLLGHEDQAGREEGPPGSLRTAAPDYYTALPPKDGQGVSYRKLPDSEVRLACSGRDRLCWSVLNDIWVSHPTWASEDAGFMTHKKNSFEDTLHKSEEERHEFQVQIEALTRTIANFNPIEARIETMSAEERSNFRLGADLGGMSPAIYERIVRKVYGFDGGNEVLRALRETPATAVPVVLARLRRKDEEWRRAQREWNRTWREIDAKNFYKALDHQGISFKQNDKKTITAKHFFNEIEKAKKAAVERDNGHPNGVRNGAGSSRGSTGSPPVHAWMRPIGHQLEYKFEDVELLQDCVKLVFTFLDHSSQQYSPAERRGMEKFLRSFIPTLFMLSAQEFNAACGPLTPGPDDDPSEEQSALDDEHATEKETQQEGVSAQDLRTRLLKTAKDNPQLGKDESPMLTRPTSPVLAGGSPKDVSNPGVRHAEGVAGPCKGDVRTNAEDIWVRELKASGARSAGETTVVRRPFFAGTTFYTLLRLIQASLLYSRLLACKEVGAQMAAEKHASLFANPVAEHLGLDEPNGPPAVLKQALEAFGGSRDGDEQPNVLYLYLLDACEKVFENELDQATFEEHMRWFFRTKAYNVFTLDRVIGAIVKQVQTVLGDNKCQELWYLLQQARSAEQATAHDVIRYRREAERNVGSDEKLYRLDWDAAAKVLRMQLMGAEDPTVDEDESAEGRWRAYVASYVLSYPTEWTPNSSGYGAVCMKRYVVNVHEEGGDGDVAEERGLAVQIERGTYKLMYAAGEEDVLVRRRGADEWRALDERACRREDERRRRVGRLLDR
ncbi:hypothetical protein K466DRAFT_475201 [Polyporus arcularius HHB13444]|uniref:Histone deacetylase interacting domain-containing protein n=1 Tax=Polyporus arcularius HHB13444 TaxID=1314778 RepID=A0A5C3Q3H9_9APHY|nr:hypothetical protein K466DRAFT_475201 [Polyporus arcularius HHB13444]